MLKNACVYKISMNSIFITLVLGKDWLIAVSDFHPIGLVTSVFTMVIKVLLLRLVGMLNGPISVYRSVFVSSRQIVIASFIANEIVEDKV